MVSTLSVPELFILKRFDLKLFNHLLILYVPALCLNMQYNLSCVCFDIETIIHTLHATMSSNNTYIYSQTRSKAYCANFIDENTQAKLYKLQKIYCGIDIKDG